MRYRAAGLSVLVCAAWSAQAKAQLTQTEAQRVVLVDPSRPAGWLDDAR